MSRKAGVIMSYILMIFEVLSTLLITPYLIRDLGQAEYGVYKLVAAITAYLLLLDLGIGNATTRYIAKYRVDKDIENERKFFGVSIIYYSLIAIITVVIGIILIMIFPKAFGKGLSISEIALGQKLLIITIINAAVTLGTSQFNNIIIAYEKYTVSKGASIIQIIIRMLLTVIVLKLGMKSVGVVTINLIMTILCRTFFVLYVLFGFKLFPKFKEIKLDFIKGIVAYSSLILLQMVATQINSSVDQILIGSLVKSSAVILAVYGVGTQIVQYYQSIGSSFTGILMPGIVKMIETNASIKEITNEMIKIGRIILLVLGLIWGCFLVNGRHFIILWAGEANEQAYLVTIILMTAYLFVLTESIGTQILWAKNEHKEQAILKITIVLLNIVLTILLIKWNPLIGATLGTFMSLMLGDVVVMNVIFYKKLKLNLLYYYKGLFKGIVPAMIISIFIGFISLNIFSNIGWISFLINIIIMYSIYMICLLVFGMNDYEKLLIKSVIRK